MSIDDQPMNVYWSGKRTETSNTFKITDKGSVAEYANLPSSGNQKGDKYEVTDDGSDYVWNGSTWNRLGAEKYAYEDIIGIPNFALDANVVHTTGNETIAGTKTFSSTIDGSAKGIASIADLGTNYEMDVEDFANTPGGSLYRVTSFKANTTSAPFNNDGDFTLLKLYPGSKNFAQFLCASPRRDKLLYGKFSAGVWGGWSDIPTSNTGFYLKGATTIGKTTDDARLILKGCKEDGYGAYILLHGGSRSTEPGEFSIYAQSTTALKLFLGKPDGTLTWDGQAIQTTSDERYKTSLSAVPDEVLDAWGDVQWGQFQYLEAVAEKGENARLHLGLIAQYVKTVFEAHNLNACEYGILCHEEREAGTMDVNGKTVAVDAVDMWMVRYAEAQAMESAYQRRRADRAEARIKALEDRLFALEAKLA